MPRKSKGLFNRCTQREVKVLDSWDNLILNVYKPAGISSYDVVRLFKKITGLKKVGHGGTLDPFAEGVLLILVGNATKKMTEILEFSKSYEAILSLGEETATGDNTAEAIKVSEVPVFSQSDLDGLERRFIGEIEQIPPQYSAKKVNGRRSYKLARKGIKVFHSPIKIRIDKIDLEQVDTNNIKINVTCSSGTYIRVLGDDIAKALGTVGHLTCLKRISIGEYNSNDAIAVSELEGKFLERNNLVANAVIN